MSDDFCKFADIFKVCVEFELEKNLRSVKIDIIFGVKLEIKKFGEKIKYYRKKCGLTQEKLAEKIDLSCRSLSFLECGVNFVTAETLDKICKTLNVTPKQLFDFEYYPKSKNLKEDISALIENNPEKLSDIYKILNGFLN